MLSNYTITLDDMDTVIVAHEEPIYRKMYSIATGMWIIEIRSDYAHVLIRRGMAYLPGKYEHFTEVDHIEFNSDHPLGWSDAEVTNRYQDPRFLRHATITQKVIDKLKNAGEICSMGARRLRPAIGMPLIEAWQNRHLDHTAINWLIYRLCPDYVMSRSKDIEAMVDNKIREADLTTIVATVPEYKIVEAATSEAWIAEWCDMPDLRPSYGMYHVWAAIFPWPPPERGVWMIHTGEYRSPVRTTGDTMQDAIKTALGDGRIAYPHMITEVQRIGDVKTFDFDE